MKGKELHQDEMRELLKEFEENPFDSSVRTPADVMRIFFQHNTPVVPVVSKRGILLGVITKETITAEMSDLARISGVAIDKFITKIARKMGFDELLPYLSGNPEFTVINLFGEVTGTWSRLQFLGACEGVSACDEHRAAEIESTREEQQIQWMVYHVLEHIPRGLYAVNEKGKTVFYNSFFEELYLSRTGKSEVDIPHVEKLFESVKLNDFFHDAASGDICFRNTELDVTYEKIPMKDSAGGVNGYLYYFGRSHSAAKGALVLPAEGSLVGMLEFAERQILVTSLERTGRDIAAAARALEMPRASLSAKLKKYGIVAGEEKS